MKPLHSDSERFNSAAALPLRVDGLPDGSPYYSATLVSRCLTSLSHAYRIVNTRSCLQLHAIAPRCRYCCLLPASLLAGRDPSCLQPAARCLRFPVPDSRFPIPDQWPVRSTVAPLKFSVATSFPADSDRT